MRAACLLALPLLIMTVMLIPAVSESVSNLIHATMTTKLASQSGEERMRWNQQAIGSFFDTSGMGAGLGSIRTSSFLIALLANVGIPGTIICMLFFFSLIRFVVQRDQREGPDAMIGLAALLSCISQFTAASMAAGAIDLGPLFGITAGLAAGYGLGPVPVLANDRRDDRRRRGLPWPAPNPVLQSSISPTIQRPPDLPQPAREVSRV